MIFKIKGAKVFAACNKLKATKTLAIEVDDDAFLEVLPAKFRGAYLALAKFSGAADFRRVSPHPRLHHHHSKDTPGAPHNNNIPCGSFRNTLFGNPHNIACIDSRSRLCKP